MIKRLHILLICMTMAFCVNAQDCVEYFMSSCLTDNHPYYKVDPPGSKSMLMCPGEQMQLTFHIYQGRDYRITTCSDLYKDLVHLQIFDSENPELLLYDNELNDMAQQFEFQVMDSRKVKAVVTIMEKESEKKNTGLLVEKVKRDCVGLLLETMITRK